MSSPASKNKLSLKTSSVAGRDEISTIDDCLKITLQSLFLAEKTTVQTYHLFMKASHCEDLQDLFFNSQQSSRIRLERIENILGRMGEVEEPAGFCATAKTLVQRAEQLCQQPEGSLRDIQIITCALEIEIGLVQKYRSLTEFCETLGKYKMGELLDRSMAEIDSNWRELNDLLKSWLGKVHEVEEREQLSDNYL